MVRGLKTTYYLRSIGATGAEKLNDASAAADSSKPDLKVAPDVLEVGSAAPQACSILDPDCDACQ